jgi:hypothetical protein
MQEPTMRQGTNAEMADLHSCIAAFCIARSF